MKKHTCKRPQSCICSSTALEPNENCPVHSLGEYPPRCEICGRFMKNGWALSELLCIMCFIALLLSGVVCVGILIHFITKYW
jgi:hypothetical protein